MAIPNYVSGLYKWTILTDWILVSRVMKRES